VKLYFKKLEEKDDLLLSQSVDQYDNSDWNTYSISDAIENNVEQQVCASSFICQHWTSAKDMCLNTTMSTSSKMKI
jgi:hypothetical protein